MVNIMHVKHRKKNEEFITVITNRIIRADLEKKKCKIIL